MTSEISEGQPQSKRKATAAGLASAPRSVKRRASKACCCCRARKVRCDVIENGSPCTNCRLDEVECVVTESKRRKKSRPDEETPKVRSECSADPSEDTIPMLANRVDDSKITSSSLPDPLAPLSPTRHGVDLDPGHHVPHLIYQTQGHRMKDDNLRRMSTSTAIPPIFPISTTPFSLPHIGHPDLRHTNTSTPRPTTKGLLPDYIRPLPAIFQEDDIDYLERKGSLAIPSDKLRNELLKSYVQYVHTYMPLLELDEFLGIILRNDTSQRMSLLLFQAVMFAGAAFVDIKHLKAAGFESRKAARKSFFRRARLLYDFDYEIDRISLVQSLLLMTHWYEKPDDQKDTWHWMGVSLSLAHTIGLHRDPTNSNMDLRRQKLWKRIWWCTYTRDRLIALGMRRPTRIKDEDCDVPFLTMNDFEFKPFSPEVLHMMGDCELTHNVGHQKELASMFIQKTKLCLCISHVLSAQYSILSHKLGGTTETTMMLVQKKSTAGPSEIKCCEDELEAWLRNLPTVTQYQPCNSASLTRGEEVLHMHRALLKLIYLATSSALHRPQVLPTTTMPQEVEATLQASSRTKVRNAAVEITNIAQDLHLLDLTPYLPTSSVTVLLPAVIIHLLDIKSNDIGVRAASLHRFYQCMDILQRLREIYASADFATLFLEAAIRKAGIQIPAQEKQNNNTNNNTNITSNDNNPAPVATAPTNARLNTLTPPPDSSSIENPMNLVFYPPPPQMPAMSPIDRHEDGNFILVATPPYSVGSENGSHQNINMKNFDANISTNDLTTENDPSEPSLAEFINLGHDADIAQNDLDALINFDDNDAEIFTSDDTFNIDFTMPSFAGDADKVDADTMSWMRELGDTTNPQNQNNDNNNDDHVSPYDHGHSTMDPSGITNDTKQDSVPDMFKGIKSESLDIPSGLAMRNSDAEAYCV